MLFVHDVRKYYEINEFEECIINKYDDIKNNYANGIYARIRLILFCKR